MQDHRELIPAQAADRIIGVGHFNQARGNGAQHDVTRMVTMHVIDLLEAIKVEHGQRGLGCPTTTGFTAARDFVGQRGIETATVEQTGQRIRFRQFTQTVTGVHQFGNLEPAGDIALYPALSVLFGDDGGRHPVQRPILGTVADIALPQLARLDGTVQIPEEIRVMIAGIDDPVRGTDQFRPRVLTDFTKTVIHIGNDPLCVGNGDDQDTVNQVGPEISILMCQCPQPIIVLQCHIPAWNLQ